MCRCTSLYTGFGMVSPPASADCTGYPQNPVTFPVGWKANRHGPFAIPNKIPISQTQEPQLCGNIEKKKRKEKKQLTYESHMRAIQFSILSQAGRRYRAFESIWRGRAGCCRDMGFELSNRIDCKYQAW